MSHYEARLQADLDEIKGRLGAVGEAVRGAVDGVMEALAAADKDRLNAVVLGDHPINREIRAIDALCHAFIARHLPAAQHLRFVSSAMRLSVALERIGDYAVSIGRVGARMSAPVDPRSMDALLAITLDSTLMLEQAIQAFLDGDLELARSTKALAERVDQKIQAFFDRTFAHAEGLPLRDGFAVLTIAARLERVSDQAKNVCEEELFIATGQTKPPKVYRVLFVDRRNDLVGPLAVALARRAFPRSGTFRTEGLEPAAAPHAALGRAAELLGLDVEGLVPGPLTSLGVAPPAHHVIVLLEGEPHAALPPVPFATAVVRWSLGRDLPIAPTDEALAVLGRELGHQIRSLMEVLRGPDAD